MPALPSRIGFITQAFRVVTAGPDEDVVERFGDSARDTPDPLQTYFSDRDDAQILADERLAILSPERRRLAMTTAGAAALPSSVPIEPVVPTVQMIDAERGVDRPGLLVEITIDFERDRSTLVAWG